MQKCTLIVFRPYDTSGVFWEFEQIVWHGYLQKTILVVEVSKKIMPRYLGRYEAFKENILKTTGVGVGEHNPKKTMTYFDENNQAWETDDYFDIPVFRKVFYEQFIMRGKGIFKV